jgi:hypothetical protein
MTLQEFCSVCQSEEAKGARQRVGCEEEQAVITHHKASASASASCTIISVNSSHNHLALQHLNPLQHIVHQVVTVPAPYNQ